MTLQLIYYFSSVTAINQPIFPQTMQQQRSNNNSQDLDGTLKIYFNLVQLQRVDWHLII